MHCLKTMIPHTTKCTTTSRSMPGTASVYVLGEGRLVNLACADGHPVKSWT